MLSQLRDTSGETRSSLFSGVTSSKRDLARGSHSIATGVTKVTELFELEYDIITSLTCRQVSNRAFTKCSHRQRYVL